MHLKEVRALEPIHTTTQVLAADDKRLHVFQTIFHTPTGDALATAEQMLLHVDTKAQKAVPGGAGGAGEGCADRGGAGGPADAGRRRAACRRAEAEMSEACGSCD